jgi:mono/diheme cytochrome c family protein
MARGAAYTKPCIAASKATERDARVLRRPAMSRLPKWLVVTAAILTIGLIAFGLRIAYELRQSALAALSDPVDATADEIKRGEYLALVGNCAACHTAKGGAMYAGGRAIETPFGNVYASNLTPEPTTGIGLWSSDAFYRAMHHGVSRDGRLLIPAFPFANYTHVTRADSDAIYKYLMRGVKPVAQANRAHELRSPYNWQLAQATWRVLFFKADSTNQYSKLESAPQRGEYLARGLGHCSACHAERNALGAAMNDQLLAGALMPMQDWYAPSLHRKNEAGVQHWQPQQVIALLKDGVTRQASVAGPMAEVVAKSTQHWSKTDLADLTTYLQTLPLEPDQIAAPKAMSDIELATRMAQGASLYQTHCATCHGEQGQGAVVTEGAASIALPALAGNRAVTMNSTVNLVRMMQYGGFAPSTQGNPRPYGMPPFQNLSRPEMAALITYIRRSWGNDAPPITDSELAIQLQSGQ